MAEEVFPVSRETSGSIEDEPPAAGLILGDALPLAQRFAADLLEYGERLGLIGPLESARIWSRHILNSALVAPFLRADSRLADVGSGAGLPGLVLALARPDVEVTLIEPMERRTEWLRDEADRLGLTNVMVLRARAEEARDAGPFDQVTARAVSALRTLIPISAPLVRVGGELLFLKGARVEEERSAAAKVMQKHRIRDAEVLELGVGLLPESTRLFRATVGGAS